MSSECSHQTTSWMKHEEDEQRPNNTNNNKSIVVSGKVLVLFVFVSLSAMVFLSYFPPATTSSSLNVLDKNAEEDDGLLLPIAKEELEEVWKEEQGR
ncbi:unnamed protein product [Bathycoccus prasinos]